MTRPARMFVWLVMTIAVSAAAVSTAYRSKSVWAGVYTKAQAEDGEALFSDHCANCHGDDLAGIEEAPALAGGTFGETWKGATLKKLFERVESMPPTKPKSLSGKQYVDILAYVLSASELPAGNTPLEADRSTLADIIFSRVRPQP